MQLYLVRPFSLCKALGNKKDGVTQAFLFPVNADWK